MLNCANKTYYTIQQINQLSLKTGLKGNNEWKGRYDNSNIRFKIFIVRSNLCDYTDLYILAKEL